MFSFIYSYFHPTDIHLSCVRYYSELYKQIADVISDLLESDINSKLYTILSYKAKKKKKKNK